MNMVIFNRSFRVENIFFACVLSLSCLLAFITSYLYESSEKEENLVALNNRANVFANDIKAEFYSRFVKINSVANMFASSNWVSYEEFNKLVELVYQDFPENRRVTWISRFLKQDINREKELVRKNSHPLYENFQFFDLVDGQLNPPSGIDNYIYSIVYTYPETKQPHFIGRSLGFHSPIIETLSPAIESLESYTTSMRMGLPPVAKTPIYLIVQPVRTVKGQGEVSGFVISSNVLSDIFQSTINKYEDDLFDYSLKDHENSEFLFPENKLLLNPPLFSPVRKHFVYPFNYLGQDWKLVLLLKSTAFNESSILNVNVLFLCLAIAIVFSLLLRSMLSQHLNLKNQVHDKTAKLNRLVELQEEQKEQLKSKNDLLHETVKRVKRITEEKSMFLANMSHEIRTPLNGIFGMVELIGQTPLSKQQLDYLDKMEISAKHLASVINDILDFSKLEANKIEIDNHPFSIFSIIDNLKAVLGIVAFKKGIELKVNLAVGVHPDLLGDSVRINQILLNLCSNALKFTESGSVTIDISSEIVTANSTETEYVLFFKVTDTGIGIEEDKVKSLFEAFSQADVTTTRQYGGTGLGLSISYKLCELMGGTVKVESEYGKGSTFIASLQVNLNDKIIENETYCNAFVMRIFAVVIDDNLISLDIVESNLQSMGAKVETFLFAKEALAFIIENPNVNTVVVDWAMPGMDGKGFLKELKAAHLHERLNIIVLSSYDTSVIRTDAYKYNVNTILQKPCQKEALYKAINGKEPHNNDLAKPSNGLDRKKVLVAEDNTINQMIIRELLKSSGAEVHMANNGRECVNMLQSLPHVDLILMDIQMPEMDGIEATQFIRDTLKMTSIPIVAITANVIEENIQHYMELGMNGHIGKPFKAEDVKQYLTTILQGITEG